MILYILYFHDSPKNSFLSNYLFSDMEHFGMFHVLSFGLREHTTYIFINVDGSLLRLTISISYCLLRFNGPVVNSIIVDSTLICLD